MKIEYWQAKNGQWYFHIKAGNGKVIAQSEGYTRKAKCKQTINVLYLWPCDGDIPRILTFSPKAPNRG